MFDHLLQTESVLQYYILHYYNITYYILHITLLHSPCYFIWYGSLLLAKRNSSLIFFKLLSHYISYFLFIHNMLHFIHNMLHYFQYRLNVMIADQIAT